jgi:hypothetical protein
MRGALAHDERDRAPSPARPRARRGRAIAPSPPLSGGETAAGGVRDARSRARDFNGLLRHGKWDGAFVALALAHGALVAAAPSVPVIALGLWWNANTISHNFVHAPFFRRPSLNAVFSAYLSLLLGLPQRLWRDRHLAHHAGKEWRWRGSGPLAFEMTLVAALWGALAAKAPGFLVSVYLPGFLIGLFLCWVQGHFEHRRGTTSHYGRIYNFLFFNDGYHVEHHARPLEHWRRLPQHATPNARASGWPAVLRWLEGCNLDGLEQLVLRSRTLQRYVLTRHERAIQSLLPGIGRIETAGVVGGGLFPRTALILRRLLPEANITIIDANPDHLRTARRFLDGQVTCVQGFFESERAVDFDLVVIPLAYVGNRGMIYRRPPARVVLVHDWIWRRRGPGAVVSWILLKRVNRVTQ